MTNTSRTTVAAARALGCGAACRRTSGRAARLSRAVLAVWTVVFAGLVLDVASARPSPRKLIFAHYMVCCPLYGHGQTVDQFEAEFREAKRLQIDGFVLNCGAWIHRYKYYREIAARMFEAADRIGGDFKLFFSADVVTGLLADEAVDMVTTYGRRKSYMYIDGRPALSTWHGSVEWSEEVVAKLDGAGLRPFFISNYIRPRSGMPAMAANVETPHDGYVRLLTASVGELDGFFYFGAAGMPDQIAASSRAFGRELAAAGKSYMAPVTPYYRGHGPNNRMFDASGLSGIIEQWRAAIDGDADFVQIVTWNDWGESSYVAPVGEPLSRPIDAIRGARVLAHDGFLAASQYYMTWFKTGAPPAVVGTRLYYAYQPHPRDCGAEAARPRGWQALGDRVYALVVTATPGSLRIAVGGGSETIEVAPGVTLASAAMTRDGSVSFALQTAGARLTAEAPLPVLSNGLDCSFNYFAAEAALRRNDP